jgi:ankyrin repeat protein
MIVTFNEEYLVELLEKDDVTDELKNRDTYNNTILTYVFKENFGKEKNEDYVKRLIEKGASEIINYQDNDGFTALMHALAINSTEKTIKMILDAGADVNIKTNDDYTALLIISPFTKSMTERPVEMLLDAGADVNIQSNDGYTALMYSSQTSNTTSTEKM